MQESVTDALATEAARWVVDSGLEYGAAKAKAARALGRRGGPSRQPLPSDEQVEDQVRELLALFCADSQPAELLALRHIARDWMDRLAAFRPHLGGAVWRGTATRHSAIRIDLYCDDGKSAEIALLNQGIRYDVGSVDTGRNPETDVLTVQVPCPALQTIVPVHLLVHDHDALRGALKPDSRGRTWRGDMAALERLLDESASEHAGPAAALSSRPSDLRP